PGRLAAAQVNRTNISTQLQSGVGRHAHFTARLAAGKIALDIHREVAVDGADVRFRFQLEGGVFWNEDVDAARVRGHLIGRERVQQAGAGHGTSRGVNL